LGLDLLSVTRFLVYSANTLTYEGLPVARQESGYPSTPLETTTESAY